jgi:BirA family biotin operon repressor/biotin-[acetyl-CoA-carboxylase] ligase
MVGGRKVGGILTEACFDRDHIDYVTVGLGINVKTKPGGFPASIRDVATSLSLHTNRPILRISVLQAFLRHLEHWYEVFCKGSSNKIIKAWLDYDMLVGHTVEVSLLDSKLLGVAEEVDSNGALLVRDTTGKLHRVIAGDVVRCRIS